MTDLIVRGGRRSGDFPLELSLPGDKSISHRALILAAAVPGLTRITNLNQSSSVRVLVDALAELGVDIRESPPADVLLGTLKKEPGDRETSCRLDCSASSAAARLLLGTLSALGVGAIIDGDATLRAQPMSWVVDPLRALGANIDYRGEPGHLPVKTSPSVLQSGSVSMQVGSAQARSVVLIAAALAGISVRIGFKVHSRDHTERLLRYLGVTIGVTIDEAGGVLTIHGSGLPPIPELGVPGDPSSLAYPAAAHVLSGVQETLVFHHVCVNPTRTGFLELLQQMGVKITYENMIETYGEPMGTVCIGPRPPELRPFAIADEFMFHSLIDEVPVAFALATQARGRSTLVGGSELMFKETNRLQSTRAMLSAFGAEVDVAGDTLWVEGGRSLRCGTVPSFGDHRVAMAAVALASCLPGTTRITDGGCYMTSFPDFLQCMRAAGWDIEPECGQ